MNNGRTGTRWVVAALMLSGAVCLGLRYYNRYRVRMIRGDSVWRLTYDIRFRAAKAGSRLRAAVPSDAQHSRLFRQELRYSGLSTERLQPSRTETRELSVVTQRSGEFHLCPDLDAVGIDSAHEPERCGVGDHRGELWVEDGLAAAGPEDPTEASIPGTTEHQLGRLQRDRGRVIGDGELPTRNTAELGVVAFDPLGTFSAVQTRRQGGRELQRKGRNAQQVTSPPGGNYLGRPGPTVGPRALGKIQGGLAKTGVQS